MKKIVAFLLVLIMLSAIPTVFAVEEESLLCLLPPPEVNYLAPMTSADQLDEILDIEKFKESLQLQFNNYVASVDVSAWNIPFKQEYVNAVADVIRNDMVECFQVDLGSFWGTSVKMTRIDIKYLLTQSEYAEEMNKWEKATNEILDGIIGNHSLTDLQKALLIHDRVIVHCEYDYDDYLAGTLSPNVYTAYGVLVDRTAVCSGYAKAYRYLLDKVGIESFICTSNALNHAWNIVNMYGEYYHVDLTWDDPVWDITGRVQHTNFMQSSEKFLQSHKANDYDTTPTDTTYDDYFWSVSNTEFQLIGDEIYYIDNQNNVMKTYDGEIVAVVNDKWLASVSSHWVGNYARLSSYNDALYYSLSGAVYKFDLSTGTAEEVYRPANIYGQFYSIFGFAIIDGNIVMDFNYTPSFDGNTKQYYQMTYKMPTEEVDKEYEITGDIVPDEEVTIRLMDTERNEITKITATGTYTLSAKSGEYILEASKNGYITREYAVVIDKADVTQDIEIYIIGDTDGDGVLAENDKTALIEYLLYGIELPVELAEVADVNGDGVVKNSDKTMLNAIILGKISLDE